MKITNTQEYDSLLLSLSPAPIFPDLIPKYSQLVLLLYKCQKSQLAIYEKCIIPLPAPPPRPHSM